MNKIVLIMSVLSLSFSGVYLSYDLSVTAFAEASGFGYSYSDEVDYDSGGLTLGYETDLTARDKGVGTVYGLSYDIVKMSNTMEFEVNNGFLNLYGKYYTKINNKASAWGLLGYNFPQGDIDEWDASYSYGLGILLDNGIGFSYIINNITASEDGVDLEGSYSRVAVSYAF